ncbi:TlpA disulfide reductase family protein [Sphingobacterium multivorum]|uniref:TlpA family protein disulfide reductase n=1 Tax=Sphingobacterium multivorum TaxID=28454 RepID=UPI002FDCE086
MFEDPSTLRRISVASSSGMLRLLFDCASGRSRSVLEALPKPSRRAPEHVSTMSRRSLEAEPKASRRAREVSPFSHFCLTNFAPASAFHAIGIEFSSGSHRATPIKTRCGLDENPMKCKNSTGIAQKMVDYSLAQETHKLDYSATLGSPLLSPCYTQGQLNDCTRPKQQKRAFQKVGESRLTYGVESERPVLRFFKSICKALMFRANTLIGSVSLVAQRALKCFLFVADYKRAYRMVLTCLFLCLVSMFSLSAQTPRKDSGADGLSQIRALKVGDLVADDFFSHMHKSVDWSSKAISQTNLSAHRNKLIILDFWAPWCSSCLGSLKKLDSLKKTWDQDKVIIIPVTTMGLNDIMRTLNYFNWDYRSIYEDNFLSARFSHQALPFMVWIKDGHVIATPKAGYANTANINAVLADSNFEVFNKTDVKLIDTNITLFTKDNGLPDHVFYDSQDSKLVGYIPGYTGTNFKVFKTKDSLSLYAVNSTIDRIYQEAYKDEIYPYQIKKKAIRWDVGIDFVPYLEESKPKENWTGDLYKDKQLEKWKRQHYFSIMISVPGDSGINGARRKMQKLLADQIEQKFGLEAKIQDGETIRYPILKALNTKQQAEIRLSQKLQRPPKKGYENYAVPFGDQPHFKLFIETALKNIKSLRLTEDRIWDRTGIEPDFPAKFSFPIDIAQERKFENIQNLLKQYGLQILVEEKPVPYLYISQSAVHSKSKGHENL